MSTDVRWGEARAASVDVVAAGETMPDGQKVTAPLAIVISTDDVVVIEGSRAALEEMVADLASALADPALGQ